MIRVAIYWTPENDSALARTAARWLGRDSHNLECPDWVWPASFDESRFREIIAAPFHYGFHGTIKPPFRLRDGFSLADVADRLETFTHCRPEFTLPPFKVSRIGNFFCLRPLFPCKELTELAADTVEHFDCFQKRAEYDELQKRRSAGLSPRQEILLLRWGSPYVMDEFRFHLTLTGNVENRREREILREELSERFYPIGKEITFSSLCLFIEESGRPLRLVKRFSLSAELQTSVTAQ